MHQSTPLLADEALLPQVIDRSVAAEPHPPQGDRDDPRWRALRTETLRVMGAEREARLHRTPSVLLDQMVSGSGLYPPRLLSSDWLSSDEEDALGRLEAIVGSSNAWLARDLLAPKLYDIDVRLVLDNSGSMALDMLGEECREIRAACSGRQEWIEARADQLTVPSGHPGSCFGGCFPFCLLEPDSPPHRLRDVNEANEIMYAESMPPQTRLFGRFPLCCPCCPKQPPYLQPPSVMDQSAVSSAGMDPRCRRWCHAERHVATWLRVYRALGIEPPVYLLNPPLGKDMRLDRVDVQRLFRNASARPRGSTPLPEAIARSLQDHRNEAAGRTLLLLVLTDGEANNMSRLNVLLDAVQNGEYGDVQVCLSGLSLVREDVEWFEQEECDGTRIRTVEAYEAERQQMLRREVVGTECLPDYTYEAHLYRTLLTNLFPADYDFEAPRQTLRHRLYATAHNADRWLMQRGACCGTHRDVSTEPAEGGLDSRFGLCGVPCGAYALVSTAVGVCCCAPLFLASGCCCCGWAQGQECGKCSSPAALECISWEAYWRCACGVPLLCCAYQREPTWAERASARAAQAQAQAQAQAREAERKRWRSMTWAEWWAERAEARAAAQRARAATQSRRMQEAAVVAERDRVRRDEEMRRQREAAAAAAQREERERQEERARAQAERAWAEVERQRVLGLSWAEWWAEKWAVVEAAREAARQRRQAEQEAERRREASRQAARAEEQGRQEDARVREIEQRMRREQRQEEERARAAQRREAERARVEAEKRRWNSLTRDQQRAETAAAAETERVRRAAEQTRQREQAERQRREREAQREMERARRG